MDGQRWKAVSCGVAKSTFVIVCRLFFAFSIAFAIATVQPCSETEKNAEKHVKIIPTTLMIITSVALLVKFCCALTQNEANRRSHKIQDLKRFCDITKYLAVAAFVISYAATTFEYILCFHSSHHCQWFNIEKIHSISLTFLIFTIGLYMWNILKENRYSFVFDHLLRTSLLSIGMQITFMEMSEIFPVYGLNCTTNTTTDDHTMGLMSSELRSASSEQIESWYRILKVSTYATAIELMWQTLVCRTEWSEILQGSRHADDPGSKSQTVILRRCHILRQDRQSSDQTADADQSIRGQSSSIEEQPNPSHATIPKHPKLQSDRILQKSLVTHRKHCTQKKAESEKDKGWIKYANYDHMKLETKGDPIMIIVGIICLLSTMIPFVAIFVLPSFSSIPKQEYFTIRMICSTAFFAFLSLYNCGLFCIMKLNPGDPKIVSSAKDIQLLSWATFGGQLSFLVPFAGIITEDLPHNFYHMCLQVIVNTIEIWLQYSFLYNCLGWKVILAQRGEKWKKQMNWHLRLLGANNLIYWICNMGQWDALLMGPPEGASLSLSAILLATTVILFPISSYYRFHCAMMCFNLSGYNCNGKEKKEEPKTRSRKKSRPVLVISRHRWWGKVNKSSIRSRQCWKFPQLTSVNRSSARTVVTKPSVPDDKMDPSTPAAIKVITEAQIENRSEEAPLLHNQDVQD